MPIDPGKLRHLVTLQGETETDDGEGGVTVVVGSLGTAWADVQPLRGFERLTAQQSDRSITHRVRVWAAEVSDASAVQSFLHEGRTLEVIGAPINEGERDELLTFDVSEAT